MVGRRKGSQFMTPLELLIMQALWEQGPCNVQQVQNGLPEGTDLAYTTVQTVLNVLEKKGRVRRRLKGKAYEYRPVLTKEKVLGQAVRDLAEKLFGGSSEALVMSLIKSRQVDAARIAELSRELADEKGEDDA